MPAPAFTLLVYADPVSSQIGQVVQAMAKEAGFTVKLQSVEFTTALDLALKGQFEAVLAYWSGRPDPDGNTYIFLSCGGSLNNTRYCNADADAALDAERATGDPAGRRAACCARRCARRRASRSSWSMPIGDRPARRRSMRRPVTRSSWGWSSCPGRGRGLCCCRVAGWSSVRWAGWLACVGWPATTSAWRRL